MDTIPVSKPFRNMRPGLIAFGIVCILLGGLCLLMTPFMLIGTLMSPKGQPAMPLSFLLPVLLMYVLIAALDITLGIGSIQGKRWARSILLLWSVFWLVCGVVTMVALPFTLSNMDATFAQNSTKMPPGFITGFKIGMFVFSFFFYLVLPGAFTWFYSLRDTRLTCERLNPASSWTDRCPLSVLGLALLAAVCALVLPLMLLYAPVFPLFGHYLTGFAAVLVILVLGVLYGWSAWGMYHLHPKAWWTKLGVSLFLMSSYSITFFVGGLMKYYTYMDLPPETMKILENSPFLQNRWFGLIGLAYLLPFLGWMFYVRRYFRPSTVAVS